MLLTLLSLSISLFLIMDPIGNVASLNNLTNDISPEKSRKIIAREMFIALGIMLFFLFAGEAFLSFLQIDGATLQIAGGVILFLIALGMVFPSLLPKKNLFPKGELFFVPIATPLVASPMVLAATMIYGAQNDNVLMVGSVLIAWLFSSLILVFSSKVEQILETKGLEASERLMGLLLTLLSVQMLLQGIANFFSIPSGA